MTPVANAARGSPEFNYNEALCRARNCVERCIGILKMRFWCLLRERVARYEPEFVGRIVNVCAALHNMRLDFNINMEFDPDLNEDENVPNPIIFIPPVPLHNEGQRIRQNTINRYFRN